MYISLRIGKLTGPLLLHSKTNEGMSENKLASLKKEARRGQHH